MTAITNSFKQVLDEIPQSLLRNDEREDLKLAIDKIYIEDSELDDLRVQQIRLMETFSQLVYIVNSRVQLFASEYAPVRKAAEEALSLANPKLTVDQRTTRIEGDENCAKYIKIIAIGKAFNEFLLNQLNVLRQRHQVVLEMSYDNRKLDNLTD